MARRLTIIVAGALGAALFAAFLLVGDPEVPEPPPTADDPARATGPVRAKAEARTLPGKPMASADASVEKQPVTDKRWAECADAIPDELPPALDGLGEGRTPPIVETLAASGSAEHVLAGALLRSESEADAIRADIERALALDGDNPLVVWHASALCREGRGGDYCDSPSFDKNESELLGSNAAFLARRAGRLLEQGDRAGAFAELERAVAAPVYDSYWTTHVQLLERTLTLAGDFGYAMRLTHALSLATLLEGPGGLIELGCMRLATEDAQWQSACIAYFDRMVTEGASVGARDGGLSLLEYVYEKTNQERLVKQTAARRDSLQRLRISPVSDDWQDFLVVLVFDERFASAYADRLLARGELSAQVFAREEIERLKADPDYDPCALTLR